MEVLKGIPASPGIYMGSAFLYSDALMSIPQYSIQHHDVEAEVLRYKNAVEKAAKELQIIKQGLDDKDQHMLLDTHMLMLYDPAFNDQIFVALKDELKNVEWIIQNVVHELVTSLEATQDSYLIERSLDIHDISKRIFESFTL